jgi:hypothetical protein
MNCKERFEAIFSLGSMTDAAAIGGVIDMLQEKGIASDFRYDSTKISQLTFKKDVEKKNKWPHEVSCGGFVFRYGVVTAWSHCFLHISMIEPGKAIDWNEWARRFLDEPGLMQARVVDIEFDYWQNAEDFLLYASKGRDYAGLPTKSNGLPPPVEQTIIDISANPGRRIIKNGYVEAVGREMWITQKMIEAQGGESALERIKAAGWSLHANLNGVLHLNVDPEIFTEGGDRTRQAQLRAAIFD